MHSINILFLNEAWMNLSLKKIVKELILQKTETCLDPLQFTCREGRGVEDAILQLLNLVYEHLENPKTCAQLLFIDFSFASAFLTP